MTIGTEILISLSLAAALYFFCFGIRAAITFFRKEIAWPPVVLLAVGLLLLVHLAGLLTEAALPGVRAAEVVFWVVVLVGGKSGFAKAALWLKSSRERDVSEWLLPAAGVFYGVFWTLQFKDNMSLPSYNDGVAHLSWLVDIQRTGFAYLSKVRVSESAAFGLNLNPFYPTGMQSLIATVSGVWMHLGVPATVVLKAWLVCAHTAILLAVLWGLKQHWKAIPAWVLLIAALTASAAFRFPMDASTEGGLSRIVAMAIVFPLAFYVTSDVRFSLRSLAGLFVLGLFPAFLLHPSAFWMFALALGFAAVSEIKVSGMRDVLRTGVAREIVILGVALLLGAVQVGLLLKLNRTHTEPLVIPQEYLGIKGLFDKFSAFFKVVLAGTYAPQKAVRVLFHVGLVGLVYLLKTKAISTKVFLFHLSMLMFCLFAMATDVYRISGASLIGGAFYYHPARTACLLVLTVWLVSMSVFPLLLAVWEKTAARYAALQQVTPRVIQIVCVLWAVQFAVANAVHLPKVMQVFDEEFQTAKWSRLGGLLELIEERVPQDALLVANPYAFDVLGPATQRQALFVYGDYVPNRDANCKAKRKWFDERVEIFDRAHAASGEVGGEAGRGETLGATQNIEQFLSCRETLRAPLNRTMVFLLNEQAWPRLAEMSEVDVQALEQKCDGLEVLGKRSGTWVFLLR